MKRCSSRSGLTLIEVTIASSILIIVFIVIYAVFSTSDKSYRSEASLRSCQLICQQRVDEIVNDAAESGQAAVWRATIIRTPTPPAGYDKALVYLSARNAQGWFQFNGIDPDWQAIKVVLPLPGLDGTYQLIRYKLAAPTPAQQLCASVVVNVNASDLTVQFLDALGNTIDTSPSISLTTGLSYIKSDVAGFNLQPLTQVTTVDGNKNTVMMQIGIQVNAKTPEGKNVLTGYVTSIRGRNQ